MVKYLKTTKDVPYVDLMVSYQKKNAAPTDDDQDEMGPPVRYYFNS